jgi:hypothetical protein
MSLSLLVIDQLYHIACEARIQLKSSRWTQNEDPDSPFTISSIRHACFSQAAVNICDPGYFFPRRRRNRNERFTVPDRYQYDWNLEHIYRVYYRLIGRVV